MLESNIPRVPDPQAHFNSINTYKEYEHYISYDNNFAVDNSTSKSIPQQLATTATYLLNSMCNETWMNCSEYVSNHNNNIIYSTDSPYSTNGPLPIEVSFILPWWRQILWNILFVGMVLIATGGNLIVVWIVVTNKRMRTVTNYFIVNLSIADAMVSSLNVTFNYIYMLHNDWPFGEIYCKISQFVAMLSISASVFTLMAISLDRYVAIMKPLKPRMSKRCNLAIAATIWIASSSISYPMLRFFTTEKIISKDGMRTVCYAAWPDGETNHSTLEYLYNIFFMILTYFVPIILMTVTYSRVGFELWGSKAIGEYTPRQVENVKSKRRVVKMMIVVVLIFAVCWLPFHVYFILTSCYPSITEAPFIQEVYLMIYWLAMSNSMYNPIIYCWMNSRFRYGFKLFFRCCPFVHIGADVYNRRDHLTSRYSCPGSPNQSRFKRNDTEKSLIYSYPGSMKSSRLTHSGMLHNSTGNSLAYCANLRNLAPTNGTADTSFHSQHNYSNIKPAIFKNGNHETTIIDDVPFKPKKSHTATTYTQQRLEWSVPIESSMQRAEIELKSGATKTQSVGFMS